MSEAMAAAQCSSVALLLLLTCFCAVASAADQELTHLHCYFHQVVAGTPNATAITVASLHKNASTFGDVIVFDNALREGPDPASRLIGRGQGIGLHTSVDESAGGRFSAIDFVFADDGKYSGSTLATLGYFTVSGVSERSIVGGTGKLRFARGYMTSKLLSITDTSIVVVLDMYFTLPH